MDRRIEELVRDARTADKIDQERAELFRVMITTRAWHEYVLLLHAKMQGLADQILAPSGSQDGMVALEYVKGTMSGLIVARDLPSVTIAAMDQLRQERIDAAGVGEDTDVDDESA